MLRNLIFDWSGTLADDLGPVADATNRIFLHYGKPALLLEEFRERFRLPFDSFYEELLPGVAQGELDALYHQHFLERQHAVMLLPHALAFLRFCQATRRRMFLLSTIKDSHFAEQSSRLGVAHFFEQTYVGVMDKRARVAEILATHQLVPDQTAFIGDMVHDVESAHQGGVMAIATLTGFDSREKLSRANPEVMVRDLGELQKLLESVAVPDEILIEELALFARVGVPEEERMTPQRLIISLRLQPRRDFHTLRDDLSGTIDYAAVGEELRRFVRDRTDQLIETLANAMAEHLLAAFNIARVELELRKFVLPETKYVAVRIARVAKPAA